MSLRFIIQYIVRQHDSDNTDYNKEFREELKLYSAIKDNISPIGGEALFFDFIKCNKEDIKEKLILWSVKYNQTIIILIGATIFKDVVYEAIEEIVDNNISSEINILISDLTKSLTFLFDRPICGIREKTLFISMCGFYSNVMISLTDNINLLLEIIFLINSQNSQNKEIRDIKNDDNSDESFNNNNYNDAFNLPDETFNNNNQDDAFNLPDEASNNNSADDVYYSDKLSTDDGFEETKNVCKDIYKKQEENNMISVKKAKKIMGIIITRDYKECTETVQTNDAYGRIVATDIFSSINVPPCNVSAKHGYAVLTSDGQGIRKVLKVRPAIFSTEISLASGTCMRVRSGDPIPKGATAIVTSANTKIKDCDDDNDDDYFNIDNKEYEIEVLIVPKENENIRKLGEEIKFEELIVPRCNRIGTAELGILTLCNIDSIKVFKLPSVGLLSIGYELEEPENRFIIGNIYDCNRITVSSLLKKNGYDPVDFGISDYKLNAMQYKIKDALDKVDLLVIMGRANDKDILKPFLKTYFNAKIYFGRVNMKPGKSTTFATCMFNQKRKYFLCMSANPATVPVVTHVFLLPLLNKLHCNKDVVPIKISTCIDTPHELHPRPKFSWTSLKWSETQRDTFPTARNLDIRHHYMMKYQFGNALLMLPQQTSQKTLNKAFGPAMFIG